MTLTRADFEREQMARRNAEGRAEAARAEVVRLRGKVARLEMGEPQIGRRLADVQAKLDQAENALKRVSVALEDAKQARDKYKAQLAEQRAGYTELMAQGKSRHMEDVRRLEGIIAGLPCEGDVQALEERLTFAEARLRERPDVIRLAELEAEVDRLKRELEAQGKADE